MTKTYPRWVSPGSGGGPAGTGRVRAYSSPTPERPILTAVGKKRQRTRKRRGPTPRRPYPPPVRRRWTGIAWTVALPLAAVGLVSLLTDWVEWDWRIAVLMLIPAGVLPIIDPDRVADFFELDSSADGADVGSGGDLGGGGGEGGA